MSLKIDTLQLDVIINGDDSRKQLARLESEAKSIRKELKKMTEGSEEYIQKSKELKRVVTQMDHYKNKIGLTGMTMKELNQRSRELKMTLANMDPRLPQYKQFKDERSKISNRISELRGNAKRTGFSLKGMANGFNRYMGMFTAATATFAGFVLGIRSAKKAADDFGQAKANLSALTELEGKPLEWLADQAKNIGTETHESGVKITKSAEDILIAYTKMGSARAELLKNKEALNEVTTGALILAEASQMKTEPSIQAVGAAMNQFNLGSEKTNRIINAMAAGALAGSAEVDDLTESMKNSGTVADDSNMSLEQTVAILEVLAEKQLKGAEAGTKLRGGLLKLKAAGVGYASGQFNLRDALVEVNKELALLGTELEKDALKQKMFGVMNVTAGTIMLNNIDKYDKYTKAVTGTNVAFDQAIKNTTTNKAKMAQAMNKFKLVAIELGDKLTPILMAATGWTSKLMKGTIAFIDVLKDNKSVITGLIGVMLMYNAARIKSVLISGYQHIALKKGIGLRIKDNIALQASILSEEIRAASIAKTTITQKAAAIATIAWQRALALLGGPIGMVIAGVIAIGTALLIYSQRTSEAIRLKKLMLDVETKGIQNTAQERVKLELLLAVAKDEKKSKDERTKAIKKLNEISPEYLGNLSLENINTKEATAATEEYTKALIKEAEAKAALDKITEIQKEIDALKLDGTKEDATLWQKGWNLLSSGGNTFVATVKNAGDAIDNTSKKLKELTNQKDALKDLLLDESKPDTPEDGNPSTPDPLAAAKAKANLRKELEKKTNEELEEIKAESESKEEKKMATKILKARKRQATTNRKQLALQKEYEKMKLDMMDEGTAKEIAIEAEKHRQNLIRFKGHNELLELEEVRHKRAMDKINSSMSESNPEVKRRADALLKKMAKLKLEEEARKAAEEDLENIDFDVQTGKVSLEDANQEKINVEMAYLAQLYVIRKKAGEDTVNLERRMSNQIKKIDQQLYEAKLKNIIETTAAQQTQAKSVEDVMKVTLNAMRQEIKALLAKAIAGSIAQTLSTIPFPFGLIVATGAATAISALFDSVIPQFYAGNVDVIGASDGKRYNATRGGMANNPMLVKKPTMMRSANGTDYLAGEQMPELIIDGPRTRNILLNYPQIFEAIRSVPQYAGGNIATKEIRTESSMFTDPELKELMQEIRASLKGVSFLAVRNELKKTEGKITKINDKFNTEVE